jgi:hypothetical protein
LGFQPTGIFHDGAERYVLAASTEVVDNGLR